MLSGLKSTANLTALGRAVSCFEADSRLRGTDDLAIRFLDPPLAWIPRSRLLRRLAILLYDRLLPGAYLYTIARTKYIDAILRREPFLFGIAKGDICRFLAERGFGCVEELPPAELERRYLSGDDGGLLGRAVGYWALAYARRVQA